MRFSFNPKPQATAKGLSPSTVHQVSGSLSSASWRMLAAPATTRAMSATKHTEYRKLKTEVNSSFVYFVNFVVSPIDQTIHNELGTAVSSAASTWQVLRFGPFNHPLR